MSLALRVRVNPPTLTGGGKGAILVCLYENYSRLRDSRCGAGGEVPAHEPWRGVAIAGWKVWRSSVAACNGRAYARDRGRRDGGDLPRCGCSQGVEGSPTTRPTDPLYERIQFWCGGTSGARPARSHDAVRRRSRRPSIAAPSGPGSDDPTADCLRRCREIRAAVHNGLRQAHAWGSSRATWPQGV